MDSLLFDLIASGVEGGRLTRDSRIHDFEDFSVSELSVTLIFLYEENSYLLSSY
jgi:hypothetical protein